MAAMLESPVERIPPDKAVDERETLVQRLDFLRACAIRKAVGLTDEQAFARAVVGADDRWRRQAFLVHRTVVVQHRLRRARRAVAVAGGRPPRLLPDPVRRHDRGVIDEYVAACRRSQSAIAAAPLDAIATGDDMSFNLRYALTHMIEETARHCGHLDLLREVVDGATGQ
jgi:hypothetical protein